MFVFPQTVH